MKVLFCAHKSDSLGVQAIEILREIGCETKILQTEEFAPLKSIVFFTPRDGFVNWSGCNCKLAAHLLLDNTMLPYWVCSTPFRIALNQKPNGNFKNAVLQGAKLYENWFCNNTKGLPWGVNLPVNPEKIEKLNIWLIHVDGVFSQKNLDWEKTPKLHLKKKRKKRAKSQAANPFAC